MAKMFKYSSTVQLVLSLLVLLSGYLTNNVVNSLAALGVFLLLSEFVQSAAEIWKNRRNG